MVEGTACLMVTREKEKGEGEEGATVWRHTVTYCLTKAILSNFQSTNGLIQDEVSTLTIPSSLNDCIHEPSTCKPEDTSLSLVGAGNLEL